MIKDPQDACHAYAADNIDAQGACYTVTLDKDVDTTVEYTTNTWDDGAPVTKMFHRNEPMPLHMPKGTTVHGVAYRGRASGQMIFEFIYGIGWCRTYLIDDVSPPEIFGCKSTAF